jgi:hypothetical protein
MHAGTLSRAAHLKATVHVPSLSRIDCPTPFHKQGTLNPLILVKLIFGVSRVGTQLAKLNLAIFLVHGTKANWHN